jgi:hypothetical protein
MINLKIFNRKRWKRSSEVVARYRPYDIVDFGLIWVDPIKILGLCHPVKKVKSDSKIQRLRESVTKNGWNDEHPRDLHLYYLPNKKFTVSTGGDHRSYLSNELNIPKIQAYVTIVLPFNVIPEEIKSKLEYYYLKEDIYDREAKEVNDWLWEKGHHRSKYPEEKVYQNLCKLADQMYEKRKELLLSFAESINMIPIEEK